MNQSGEVVYEGKYWVEFEGEYKWNIKRRKVKKLQKLLDDFDFKGHIYIDGNEIVTDFPSCITTVKYDDGTEKTIDHYMGNLLADPQKGTNKSLTKFENKIEGILGVKKYVGKNAK